MPRLPERLGKLKGKSIDELRVRCAQAAHARLERIGLSRESREPSDRDFTRLFDCRSATGRVANAEELLQRFRQQELALGRCLPGLSNPIDAAQECERRCPGAAAAAIAAAERIADGVIELGDRVASVGPRPDWTLEPVSGKRAPAIHWSQIPFLDPRVAGDCKFTWELNRHQYFVTLGQAYALTHDDRYTTLVAHHLSTWMDENPPKTGINWTSSLESAFRVISWIWALCLVRSSARLEPSLYLRTLKYMHLHARHIERNLSTYFSPNTHLTGEALGLLYIGTAFPEFKRAQHWRALGHRILVEQLEQQILADGVYFEQSTYYHRYTTDFYLHALLLSPSSENGLDQKIRSKVSKLLDYLVHITRPDGTSPFIGDDDGGRLVKLGQRPANDFRDTLAIGAALLRRGDCKYVAGDSVAELLWLLGPDGRRSYDSLEATPPSGGSRAFVDSGYFVMRESWGPAADWAVVRCGPHASQTGAHAHADALAMELSVGGHPMLIDPGTFVYTASRADRDCFRGSAAHNTLTVDGLSSAEPAASPFKWKSAPRSRATAWVSGPGFDFFEGEHDGYMRLDAPAVHSRATFFLKGEYWVIRDRVRSGSEHHIALHWHWAPNVTVFTEDERFEAHITGSDKPRVNGRIFARAGQLSCEDGWVSSAYGTRSRAPISVFRCESEPTEELVTVLAESTTKVRLDDTVWRAGSRDESGMLTIPTGSTFDTILTGPTSNAAREHARIHSDATWTWVRHSLSGELLAFALINGRNLIIDGRPEFQADSIVDCAIGRDGLDGWRVDVQSAGPWSTISSVAIANRKEEESCAASAE